MISNSSKIYAGNREVSKIYAGNQLVFSSAWTPADLGDQITLWLEVDPSTIVLNGSNVLLWYDKSYGDYAQQSVASYQPVYDAALNRVIFDKVNDFLTIPLPSTNGTMVLSTPNGTAAYGINITYNPSVLYVIGGHDNGKYMPDNAIIGQIITRDPLSSEDTDKAIQYLRNLGGGENYGTVTNFNNWWRNWSELTSFPLIDTSNGTSFDSTWYLCSSLTSFPLIDTSNGTNFGYAWFGCSSLTSFPLIDTSNGTNFRAAWLNCTSLTSFPLIDTSNGTNFRYAWLNCTSLTSFPLIDTSNGTNFGYAWDGCTSLTSFPLIDTSSGTDFSIAWRNCSSLTSFPLLNVSNATNFFAAWYNCFNLTSFPANFFDNCSATNFSLAFTNTNLSQQSIDNILVSIESNGTSNGAFNQNGGSAPSATGEAAITALRNRGWTVAVTGGF